MSDYNKPIIVISKCLGFDNCKYDGSIENNEFIEKLKKYGYWIVGTDMEGMPYTTIDYKTKIAIVIGNEGKGISDLVSKNCDYLAKIPMVGTVNSLNASVACGIFLAEINRSRGV